MAKSKDKIKTQEVDKDAPVRTAPVLFEESIGSYTETAYLEYAMSVVKGRAIPCVEDGLKPVHRRIFYAMHGLHLNHTAVPSKSARVVGNVIGTLHPHGDQAVYEAMVRQAQDFSLRYPIVNGIGNFGSRDGDSAAAYRYTECKLQPLANALLDELNEGAVDFIPNFDNSTTEPKFLPARLPFILLNGNPGIAVGIASEIPCHNMRESVAAVIAYLEDERVTLDSLLQHLPAPDFPTGAQIISTKAELYKVYAEGRGPIRMRAKFTIEGEGTKSWKLVFHELPYGTSVKSIMEEIDNIFNPKPKEKNGKKTWSPEQLRLKGLFQNLIDRYNDESDRTTPVRLTIEPRSFKQDPQELVQILLASTKLESNYSANFVMIGRDGKPRQKGLLEIISEWSDFRLVTVGRRVRFHLEKIAARLHILDGRKLVLDHIEDVVKILRHSDEPRDELIKKYKLSDIQADDIMELRLRQIGKLELNSVEKEYAELQKRQNELQKIIATPASLRKQVIKELREDVEKYGDERRSELIEVEKSVVNILEEKVAQVAEEDISVALSEKGWVKVLRGHKAKEDFMFKEGDSFSYLFHCKNTDTLALLDVKGKIYNYPLHELGKEGAPLNTLVDMGSKLILSFPVNKEHRYLVGHEQGYGFITAGENMMTRMKAGKEFFSIPDGVQVFQPLYFPMANPKENYWVALISTENRVLIYKLDSISEIAKGKGVGLMGFNGNHKLKGFKLLSEPKLSLRIKDKKKDYLLTLEGETFNRQIQNRSVSAKGKVLDIKDKLSEVEFAS